MSWSFWISLSLSYLPIIGSMREAIHCSSSSPPSKEIWHKKGQSASLPCTRSCSNMDIQPQWFAFRENFHHQVYPSTTPLKYSLEGTSLHIKSLSVNDSGIYYCAVVVNKIRAPGAQVIGSGTTLIVKGEEKKMLGEILLCLTFVLLAMYSLAVIILIILKKKGRNISIYRQIATTRKSSSTKRRQFRAVMQELYSRRNVENSTHKDSRHPTQNQAEITQSGHSNDDIYQNL